MRLMRGKACKNNGLSVTKAPTTQDNHVSGGDRKGEPGGRGSWGLLGVHSNKTKSKQGGGWGRKGGQRAGGGG